MLISGLENWQNIDITSNTGEYGNAALNLLSLPNSATLKATIINTELTENPVFTISFKISGAKSVSISLMDEMNTEVGEPKLVENISSGVTTTITESFNGQYGNYITIILTKDDYVNKMEIKDFQMEACFESTACEIQTISAEENVDSLIVKDTEGQDITDEIFEGISWIPPPAEDVTSLTFVIKTDENGGTLYELDLTLQYVNKFTLKLYKPNGEKIYESPEYSLQSSSIAQTITLHFDGKITNVKKIQIDVKGSSDDSNNQTIKLNNIDLCYKPQVGTTLQPSSTTSTSPFSTLPPSTSTTTEVCRKMLITGEAYWQNIEITTNIGAYGNNALSTLRLPSSTDLTAKIINAKSPQNQIFTVSFKITGASRVRMVLKDELDQQVGDQIVIEDLPSDVKSTINETFDGQYGEYIMVTLEKDENYTKLMKIEEFTVEACFESTACEVKTISPEENANSVIIKDVDGQIIENDSAFEELSLQNFPSYDDYTSLKFEIQTNEEGSTLYSWRMTITFVQSYKIRLYRPDGSFIFETNSFPSNKPNGETPLTVHFDGQVSNVKTVEILFQKRYDTYAAQTVILSSIDLCYEPGVTTTSTSTPTSSTATSSVSSSTSTTTGTRTTTTATITSPPIGSTTTFVSPTTTRTISVSTTISSTPEETTSTTFRTTTITTPGTTTEKTTSEATTTTPFIPNVCYFTPEGISVYTGFEYDETTLIGWIEIDNVPGPTGDDHIVEAGDEIGENDVIHVGGCYICECNYGSMVCRKEQVECNCTYDEWTTWSSCSGCQLGTTNRTRNLIPGNYDKQCKETEENKKFCEGECTTTTTPSSWNEWGECIVDGECGPGKQIRTRCEGSEPCADYEERSCAKNCTTPVCEDDKIYKNVCDMPCNSTCSMYRNPDNCLLPTECTDYACYCQDGMVLQDGKCINPHKCPCWYDGRKLFHGETIEILEECKTCVCGDYGMDCTDLPNCGCKYSSWGNWTECINDENCGLGEQRRIRHVVYGRECNDTTETQSCELEPCGRCTENGIVYEDNEIIEQGECYERVCKNGVVVQISSNEVDGGFTDWMDWSDCNADCEGTRYRERNCTSPVPQCGGANCDGSTKEFVNCTASYCCRMTSWTEWSECSATCGGGLQYKTREPAYPEFYSYLCDMPTNETIPCNENTCNTTCQVSTWEEWGPCSEPCGPGNKTRTRKHISGDTDCPHLSESAPCYDKPCECDDYEVYQNSTDCEMTCENRHAYIRCTDMNPGCICDHGYVRDNVTNKCVNVSECYKCKLPNGDVVEPGMEFPNPNDSCSVCTCYDGTVSCHAKCNNPVSCEPGEIKHYIDDCCFVCKRDTCKLETKTAEKGLRLPGNCITKQNVTYKYCTGECGKTSHYPIGFGMEKECKCCTGTQFTKAKVQVECYNEAGNGPYPMELEVQMPTNCECNTSVCPDNLT